MATTVTTTSVSPADRQHTPAGMHHVEHEHGTMNIRDHERVFDGFVKFLVWNAVAIIVVLIFLALADA